MSEMANFVDDGVSDEIDVKLLKVGMSPRLGEQDVGHAEALAHQFDECPPIVVERSTSIVIDGVHRVLAARILGRTKVRVRFFDGSHEEAIVESIRSNIAHGKPLTLAEREAAARRVLGIRSDWSDRLVGSVCGLSDKTVGRLRKTTAEIPQLSSRIGRDGRRRPTDAKKVRDEIAGALIAKPDSKPKELAQSMATSPATIRDVRKRLVNDQMVTPSKVVHNSLALRPSGMGVSTSNRVADLWSSDSAMTSLPEGTLLAGWLDASKIEPDDWEPRVDSIPLGRIPQLIEDARSRANEWRRFASALEERSRELGRRRLG
jgi:hypothetical protein